MARSTHGGRTGDGGALRAIVLAAGQGTRMGGPKALLWVPEGRGFPREPLATRHARALSLAGCRSVEIVTRDGLAASLAPHLPAGASIVVSHAEEALGPAGSIAAAVRRWPQRPPGLALITPVDAAPVSERVVARLLEALSAEALSVADGRPLPMGARPVFEGRGGHPVLLAARALAPFANDPPPILRDLLRDLGPRVAAVAVDDPAVRIDLDTPEAFRRHFGTAPIFAGPPFDPADGADREPSP